MGRTQRTNDRQGPTSMQPGSRRPPRPLVLLCCAAGWLAGCGPEGDAPSVSSRHAELVVCADGPTVAGIDVSKWQGTIDWDAVAADGVRFAFIRVSDGTYEDPQYDRNWSEARRVGILRSTYQFFRPGGDPIVQANLLLDRMGPLEPTDLPPVVDVEAADGQSPAVVASKLLQWLEHVEAATGRTPIIYTGTWFWEPNVGDGPWNDYPLWIAQYGPECPDIPDDWSRWAFFQTSSSGRVAGIDGNVDTDLFNGDMERLVAQFGGVPECGDGHCNGGETGETCPGDCPTCEPVPPAGRAVDDSEPRCFERGGNASYWRSEGDGWDGSLWWTHTTDAAEVDNYGVWHLRFAEAGRYRVEAYAADGFAEAKRAVYRVRHDGVVDEALVDQSAAPDGWALVGDFTFAEGGEQHIRLDDNTGEPYSTRTRIGFDAVRLTRLDLPPDRDGGPGGEGGEDGGVPRQPVADAGAVGGDAGAPHDPGAEGGGLRGGGSGSGCHVARVPTGPAIVPLSLVVVTLLRLRRRRAARPG